MASARSHLIRFSSVGLPKPAALSSPVPFSCLNPSGFLLSRAVQYATAAEPPAKALASPSAGPSGKITDEFTGSGAFGQISQMAPITYAVVPPAKDSSASPSGKITDNFTRAGAIGERVLNTRSPVTCSRLMSSLSLPTVSSLLPPSLPQPTTGCYLVFTSPHAAEVLILKSVVSQKSRPRIIQQYENFNQLSLHELVPFTTKNNGVDAILNSKNRFSGPNLFKLKDIPQELILQLQEHYRTMYYNCNVDSWAHEWNAHVREASIYGSRLMTKNYL